MTTAHPTYDQLAALPSYTAQAVPAAFEDINGHLNIRHYVGIASEGLDESLVDVGIPQNWPTVAGQGVFTAEHHMTYLSELRTGDRISARVRLVGTEHKPATPGAHAGLPAKARAYGRYCKQESKKHSDAAEGTKGTPFSQCVTAMAKLANGNTKSPAKACAAETRKQVEGMSGTPFSLCVKAGKALLRQSA